MNLRPLWHTTLADYRERTRRYSFLITLGLVIYIGYLVVTGDLSVRLTSYRGVFNSSWIGAEMGLVISTFLTLTGFYLVKNTVERDIQTGVGQIIATTPTSRAAYLLGKWFSNLLVLSVMVIILALVAGLMVILRGEAAFEPIPLLAPLLVIGLPAIALTSGLAILFESVRWLRGSLGNIVFFFVIGILMLIPLANPGGFHLLPDIIGLGLVYPSMLDALRSSGVAYSAGIQISVSPGIQLQPFLWTGIEWNAAAVLPQMTWVIVSIGLVLASALCFERFDTARGKQASGKTPSDQPGKRTFGIPMPDLHLPLPTITLPTPRNPLMTLFLAETQMLLKGMRWWWYWVAAGLAVAALFNSPETVRAWLLPIAWIWPLTVWSGMGFREKRYNTDPIMFSAPRPLSRQMFSAWLAGTAVTALLGSGVLFCFLLHGDGLGTAAYLSGVVFIPSLAMACGGLSGSSKLFEVLYLLWWYSGPMNRTDFLNFAASQSAAVITGYLMGGIVLFGFATLGKQRQLQN